MKYYTLFLLALLCVFSCNKKEHDPNLVGHWTLDNNATDQSSYKSHGKIYGDPQQVAGAIEGNAFDFNGDDYIEIAVEGKNPPHLKGLSTGSISLWFKARSWDIQTSILPILYYGKADPCPDAFDATNEGMIIEVGHGGIFPSKNLFFTIYDKSCAKPTMCFDSNDGIGIIEPEQWYHFVAVVGEDFNTGYLNGQELYNRRYNFHSDSASLFFKDFLSHDKMWVGKGFWKSKEVYFDGLIDDLRIYDKPLNLEDVQELYSAKNISDK